MNRRNSSIGSSEFPRESSRRRNSWPVRRLNTPSRLNRLKGIDHFLTAAARFALVMPAKVGGFSIQFQTNVEVTEGVAVTREKAPGET